MKSQVIAIMAVMLLLSLATAVPTMITSTSAQISSPPSSEQQQSTAVDSNRIFESEEDDFLL